MPRGPPLRPCGVVFPRRLASRIQERSGGLVGGEGWSASLDWLSCSGAGVPTLKVRTVLVSRPWAVHGHRWISYREGHLDHGQTAPFKKLT